MAARFVQPSIIAGSLIALLFLLAGCGSSLTVVVPTPTASSTPSAAATATLPPATATPSPGVCNPADFPTQTPGGPEPPSGPPAGFQYPPQTYNAHLTDAAGTYYFRVCSSGNPASILAFMKHSIPAGGWTITATAATTLAAIQTNAPQEGLCASVTITVGSHSGYPGEWDLDFHSPTSSCTP